MVFGCEFVGLCYTCVWVLILKLVFTLRSLNVNNQTELNWTVEEEKEEEKEKKKKLNFEVRHPRCVSNKSNVKCIQCDVKHNLVLDDILVY